MKKISTVSLLFAGLLMANADIVSAKNFLNTTSFEVKYQHETSSEKLVLNNGAKWKVDRTTNNNVSNLKQILKRFNNSDDRSLKAYKMVGLDLSSGLAKMINECKMQGPDHLALHKWLEPLMAQVEKLKHAPTKAAAVASIKSIQVQLNNYNRFFA
ncbi:MAG: hypothetical protein ACXVAY_01845 [Mucilaginibacter sp.]